MTTRRFEQVARQDAPASVRVRRDAPASVRVRRDAEPALWSLVDHAVAASGRPAPADVVLTLDGLTHINPDGSLAIALPLLSLHADELCALITMRLVGLTTDLSPGNGWLRRVLSGAAKKERAALTAGVAATSADAVERAIRGFMLAKVSWPVFRRNWLVAQTYCRAYVPVVEGFRAMLEANRDDLAPLVEDGLRQRPSNSMTWNERIIMARSLPANPPAPSDLRPVHTLFNRLHALEETLLGNVNVGRRTWDNVVSAGFERLHLSDTDGWLDLLDASGAVQDLSLAATVERFTCDDWQQLMSRLRVNGADDLPKDPADQARAVLRTLALGSLLAQKLVFVNLNWHRNNDVLGLESTPWDLDALVRDVPGNPAAGRAMVQHLADLGVDPRLQPGARRAARFADEREPALIAG